MRRAGCTLALLVALAMPAAASSALQPFQMVRSLQLLQDRIAGGDHAALPMQNKLLAMIDSRMKEATALEFADARNFEALLVYGMSGGNPRTINAVLSRLHPDDAQRRVGRAVLDFLHGQPARARNALAGVEPIGMPNGLGAFVALVKGSVASDQAASALGYFDQARLMGQGTLVEEAALRRSIPLAVAANDAPRFLRLSSRYVRYFLRSPYAGEFAQAFVSGIVALYATIDMDAVDEIVRGMAPEQREVIYLRLARKGAIDAMPTLAAHAAVRLEAGEAPGDPRAALYAAMTALKGGRIDDAAAMLDAIAAERLSGSDRELYLAAKATVAGVLARPQPSSAADPKPVAAAAPAVHEQTGLSETASQASHQPAVIEPQATAAESAPAAPDLEIVTSAREKLAEIDRLLQETTE